MYINILQLLLLTITIFYLIICVSQNNSNKDIDINQMSSTFRDIYKNHIWIRGSGRGSDKECTYEYRLFLKRIFNLYNITKIIDFGCGDWKMLNSFNFTNSQLYIGYDIVKSVVYKNINKYSKKNIKFYHIENSLSKMQNGDIIMIKDVFQHWNNKNILNFIKTLLKKYKYALITNHYDKKKYNDNINIGNCRALDLEQYPFNMKSYYKKDMYFCKELKRIYIFKNY